MTSRALLFDIDGTVIDSEHGRDRITAAILAKYGARYDCEVLKPQLVNRSSGENERRIVQHHKLDISLKRFSEERRQRTHEMYAAVGFVPGFLSFYERARKEFSLVAAVTSIEPEHYDLVNKRLRLDELFTRGIFFTQEYAPKPSPEALVAALNSLDVATSEAVLFEDSPHGILMGVTAGVQTYALCRTFDERTLRRALPGNLGGVSFFGSYDTIQF